MKARGIYSALTFSIFFHLILIVATVIVARHSYINRVPAPYVVSLVSDFSDRPAADVTGADEGREPRTKTPASEPVKTPPAPRQKKTVSKADELRVTERIAALQAKKRIEKSAALKKIVDVGTRRDASSGGAGRSRAGGNKAAGASQPGGGDYYSRVVEKIRQQWIFPESTDRDLETVISIVIARDGNITIGRIEKSSGNALFDRSVLRAITRAGPLPPPSQEMEIGVRFRP